MSNEFHPLVELMLARMKSHPEEFTGSEQLPPEMAYRWSNLLAQMEIHLTPEEEVAYKAAAREIRMNVIHERALDELLNGEDRRRKEREMFEAEQNKPYMNTPSMAHNSLQSQALQAQMQQAFQGLELAKQKLDNLKAPLGLMGTIKKGLGL